MKSSFGRSFFTAAAILLVAMTILGASFQIKVNQFLTDTTVSGLQQNADTIAELAAAYFNNGGLYNRTFQLNLTVASRVSGADAVVCDSDGNVVLCSDAPSGCEHQGLQLNQAYDFSKPISCGGVRRSASSEAEERVLVKCFFLHGLTSISTSRLLSPTTWPR